MYRIADAYIQNVREEMRMNEYSDECVLTFLKNQGQLFSEPVAETKKASASSIVSATGTAFF